MSIGYLKGHPHLVSYYTDAGHDLPNRFDLAIGYVVTWLRGQLADPAAAGSFVSADLSDVGARKLRLGEVSSSITSPLEAFVGQVPPAPG